MSDKKKRPLDDDNDTSEANEDQQQQQVAHISNTTNDDIDQLINRIVFNRQLANSYKTRDQQYKQRLETLKNDLNLLKNGNLDYYKQKTQDLEADYDERMATIRLWYEIKKNEIESQFDCEQKLTQQEYYEKRKELKDNLRYEYEEKRRLIENEKQALDINLDTNESKPTVTRKLRRRTNQNQLLANHFSTRGGEHDLQFASLLINSSIVTPNTSQITLNSMQLNTSSTQAQTSLNIQSIVNMSTIMVQEQQRKQRRPSPSMQIACTLNDDEIGDDLKYLSKNSNLLPAQILSVFNAMQHQSD